MAVQALSLLDGSKANMKAVDIAQAIGSSTGFVTQVLNPLVRQGWVVSEPGPTGGYSLENPLDSISVLDVIEAVEGPTSTEDCVLSDVPCNSKSVCALHFAWSKARTNLLDELEATSVAEAIGG